MKRLNIDEENEVAIILAKSPTESTKHMGTEEREEGILTMLRDLELLARKDGCVAAAWALEFIVTHARAKPRLLHAWLAAARQHFDERQVVPVVVGVELYEHFGSPAKVTEIHGNECCIEGRFGETTTVYAEELELRQ